METSKEQSLLIHFEQKMSLDKLIANTKIFQIRQRYSCFIKITWQQLTEELSKNGLGTLFLRQNSKNKIPKYKFSKKLKFQ